MAHGTFLVVEGTDRSSKDTQVAQLIERLEHEGYEVVAFDFPQYEQPSSYFINEYRKGKYGSDEEVGPYTGSLFYALDRYQAAPAIRQAVEAGKVVIANRFTGSNMAYQGTKFDQSEHRRGYFIWLDNLEYEMLKIPRPDRSIVLRTPSETAQSLVEVYDDLCQLFPKDFVRIDCTRDKKLLDGEIIHALLWQTIEPLLPPKPKKQSSTTAAKPASVSSKRVDPTKDKTTQQLDNQRSEAEDASNSPESNLAWGNLTVAIDQLSRNASFDQKGEDGRYKYYIPEWLDAKTKTAYVEMTDRIYDLYSEMVRKTTTYVRSISDAPKDSQDEAWHEATRTQACNAVCPVLPVAALLQKNPAKSDHEETARTYTANTKHALQKLADQYLPENHASETEPVTLTSVWPRNELDLVADMLYEFSNLPLKDIEDGVSSWPIARRMDIFESYMGERLSRNDRPGPALDKARYSWDLVCDFGTFCNMQRCRMTEGMDWQLLTPRYGYDIPQLIEDAGLTDSFEECFDLSLQLYSTLQSAGFSLEAQYATLLGHNMRWKVTYNASEAFRLHELCTSQQDQPNVRKLLQTMHKRLAESHPMMADAMKFVNQD